jgi:hypothetical protein
MILARRRAFKIAEGQLRGQGIRPHHIARKIISGLADEYLAEHRAELIAEATEIVDRWKAEGFFGKNGASEIVSRRDRKSTMENGLRWVRASVSTAWPSSLASATVPCGGLKARRYEAVTLATWQE